MKKIINNPEQVVEELLEGMAAAHPQHLTRLPGFDVLLRSCPKEGKVALVSGGGSGHEPAHAGYVGRGMLDAAVAGAVFTSPTPDQVFAAIQAVDRGKGVLLIIKNYSGDLMNFEMAAEMAQMEGIKVAKVVVNDDVAVENSTYTMGRRGIAGTVLVHKIAGALAEQGASLEEVAAVAEKVIANVRTKGMALTPCIVPAVGRPTFELGENELEIGLGIHGEPGTQRTAMLTSAEIAAELGASIVDDLPFQAGDEVALLVNGLGSTPLMELYILNRDMAEFCRNKGLKICHTYVGEMMTALEMAGASLTLLKLDEQLKALLEEPADTPAFKQWRCQA